VLARLRELVGERRIDEARALAEATLAGGARHPDILFTLGALQAEQGDFPSALRNVREALAADASWTRRLLLANILRDAGDPRGAEVEARTLVDAEPNRVTVRNTLGLGLHDQGRDDEAVATFRAASALDPRYVAGYANAASSLQALGRVSE